MNSIPCHSPRLTEEVMQRRLSEARQHQLAASAGRRHASRPVRRVVGHSLVALGTRLAGQPEILQP